MIHIRRLCRDRPLFAETLDVIKFVCKDVWIALWDKQVDNLRTNHRVGVSSPPGNRCLAHRFAS
jgi:hypothetical protein